jgi:predicted MPP superfamily phosphohydrolase
MTVPESREAILPNIWLRLILRVLKDVYKKVGGGVYLVGRNNAGMHSQTEEEAVAQQNTGNNTPAENIRKELSELVKGTDASLPVILLDHQPADVENAVQSKVDLQLAGHSHGGQVFPISLVTGLLYETDWGLLTKGAYNLIVSSGYGTWGPPLRIGNNPEIVDITMRFKQ